MQGVLEISLKKLKWVRNRKSRMAVLLLVLSLAVVLDIFWILRQPGLTLAGDADCGILEHTHDEECRVPVCICTLPEEPHTHDETCYETKWSEGHPEQHLICGLSEEGHTHTDTCWEWEILCGCEEHVHSLACYSDKTADVETMLDWQDMFAEYPYTGNLREDLAGIARTQAGYSESTLNFTVDSDGGRHGYTRYGAWYGMPYQEWSTLFVSFCLHYAGADSAEYPGNTGAAAMAEAWEDLNRYVPAGEYVPAAGDLVFFAQGTVGIVTEVQNASFYALCGDVEDAVRGALLPLSDASVIGWGMTAETLEEETVPEETESEPEAAPMPDETILLDISDGPAVFLAAGTAEITQMESISLRSSGAITDLQLYLEDNDGSYFFTLLDFDNLELPKDEQGNYIAQAYTGYKLTISFTSPKGFQPGTYQYQVPNGLLVDGGEGTFVLTDGTEVGEWTVTDTGLITLVFNEHINSRTDITISSTLGIHFPEQVDPIDFDGQITVVVEPPPPQNNPTYVNKWGNQGGTEGSDGDNAGKIYWGIEIIGNQDSQIPGNIITDQILLGEWSKTHRFTESDIAGGLSFGASDPAGNWHNWQVSVDDPHLIWTETGWTYKMPKTVTCQYCGEIELGNAGWVYYIHYTSTPDYAGTAGTFGYENEVTVDGAYGYSWVNFTHGEVTGEITKKGSFVSDADGGAFLWEFQATIPGRQEGQRAIYHWYIMDNMSMMDNNGYPAGVVENDGHLATVLATYNGTTITVPRIQDATDDDLFAWDNAWTAVENGISHGREFNLLCRCECTPDTCHWEGGCGQYWYTQDDGTTAAKNFCQCWLPTETITFTFIYKTEDMSVVEAYGGLGYKLLNDARLYYKPDGTNDSALVSSAQAVVQIPGLFRKELTHDFDGYTASYKVTINEAKLVLTNGTPLYVHDVMTDTLAYISGSLVITAEDANGKLETLRQDVDYTVAYDGTGNQTDAAGKEVHVLDITILHPQPVMYILEYDATLILPKVVTGGIRYTNSATITLWGEKITDSTVEKVHADINIAAKSYRVEMFKTSSVTGEPLGGATFGLYNEHGGLITTDVTDANGQLFFHTNVIEGVILRAHELYYMQELKAPPGYQLDDTQYWFCFCDETWNSCTTCEQVLAETEGSRIPFEQVGKVHAENMLQHYDLPATGGSGLLPLILVGVSLITAPLVYTFARVCKRERRRSG